jgi:hypothetical protein
LVANEALMFNFFRHQEYKIVQLHEDISLQKPYEHLDEYFVLFFGQLWIEVTAQGLGLREL